MTGFPQEGHDGTDGFAVPAQPPAPGYPVPGSAPYGQGPASYGQRPAPEPGHAYPTTPPGGYAPAAPYAPAPSYPPVAPGPYPPVPSYPPVGSGPYPPAAPSSYGASSAPAYGAPSTPSYGPAGFPPGGYGANPYLFPMAGAAVPPWIAQRPRPSTVTTASVMGFITAGLAIVGSFAVIGYVADHTIPGDTFAPAWLRATLLTLALVGMATGGVMIAGAVLIRGGRAAVLATTALLTAAVALGWIVVAIVVAVGDGPATVGTDNFPLNFAFPGLFVLLSVWVLGTAKGTDSRRWCAERTAQRAHR